MIRHLPSVLMLIGMIGLLFIITAHKRPEMLENVLPKSFASFMRDNPVMVRDFSVASLLIGFATFKVFLLMAVAAVLFLTLALRPDLFNREYHSVRCTAMSKGLRMTFGFVGFVLALVTLAEVLRGAALFLAIAIGVGILLWVGRQPINDWLKSRPKSTSSKSRC